jgi:hypothetical protein
MFELYFRGALRVVSSARHRDVRRAEEHTDAHHWEFQQENQGIHEELEILQTHLH